MHAEAYIFILILETDDAKKMLIYPAVGLLQKTQIRHIDMGRRPRAADTARATALSNFLVYLKVPGASDSPVACMRYLDTACYGS